MKKVLSILGALAVIGSASCYGVGGVNLTNWDTEKPVFYLTSGSLAGAGTYVEVLAGPDAANLKPLVSGGSSVFELADGMFDGGSTTIEGVANNGTAFFEVHAWKGNGVSGGWASAAEAASATWSQTVGAIDPLPAAPNPAGMQFPAGVTIQPVVPEPSTIALGLIGAAGLLFFRRK